MTNLTLQQLFGVNATQDSQTLLIKKSDLLLTPQINNTAGSLLIAILLKALENFQGLIEDENGQPIADENNRPIEFDNTEAFEFLKVFRWDTTFADRSSIPFIRDTIVIERFILNED